MRKAFLIHTVNVDEYQVLLEHLFFFVFVLLTNMPPKKCSSVGSSPPALYSSSLYSAPQFTYLCTGLAGKAVLMLEKKSRCMFTATSRRCGCFFVTWNSLISDVSPSDGESEEATQWVWFICNLTDLFNSLEWFIREDKTPSPIPKPKGSAKRFVIIFDLVEWLVLLLCVTQGHLNHQEYSSFCEKSSSCFSRNLPRRRHAVCDFASFRPLNDWCWKILQ